MNVKTNQARSGANPSLFALDVMSGKREFTDWHAYERDKKALREQAASVEEYDEGLKIISEKHGA